MALWSGMFYTNYYFSLDKFCLNIIFLAHATFAIMFQKRGAQMVVLEGRRRQVWENVWSDSCLDLHLMSSGAARAMVHAWLLNIRSIVFEGHELPKLLR